MTFLNKNGPIVHRNGDLMGENCEKSLFIQKCPQISEELSTSNTCMLVTFSMSVGVRIEI